MTALVTMGAGDERTLTAKIASGLYYSLLLNSDVVCIFMHI